MNFSERLRQQIVELYALARVQKSARMALRAFWLGAAGMIVGWGIHAIWAVLPNPLTWFLIGLLCALFPIAAALVSFASQTQWIQKIDRQLGLREQLSTAWEIIQKKQREDPDEPVRDLLVQDALQRLPQVKTQTLKDGWYRPVDVISSVIVVMLACMLLAASLLQPADGGVSDTPPVTVPQTSEQQVPGQGEQPGSGAQDQAGQGNEQGNTPGEQPGQGQETQGTGGQQEQGSQGQQQQGSSPDPNAQDAIEDALQELGSQLSEQAGTYELGNALENMELDEAADALQDLSEQLEDLSPESRENMADAMQAAGEALEQAGEQNLSEDMQNAGESLANGENNQAANQALDQVADGLQQLANGMNAPGAADTRANDSNSGNPEPLPRLSNEGGDFDLPLENSEQSGLLSPAQPEQDGEGTASGTMDATRQTGQDMIQSPLLPNTFLWKWRNVVSKYFQR